MIHTTNHEPPDERQLQTRLECLKHLRAFAEGDFFPLRQKRIKALLGAKKDYIVFLDETDHVDWTTQADIQLHEKHGEVAARVTDLQALSETLLPRRRHFDFRYRLAMGLVRSFAGDMNGADQALQQAVDRLRERVRFLYLIGSFLAASLFVVAAPILWINGNAVSAAAGAYFFVGLIGACAGAMGGLVSVLLKKEIPVTSDQPSLYFLDGACRIVLGALGGLLAVVAIKENILAGFLDRNQPGTQIAASSLAGAVERFVPSLVMRAGIGG